jgi:hypothetical protein
MAACGSARGIQRGIGHDVELHDEIAIYSLCVQRKLLGLPLAVVLVITPSSMVYSAEPLQASLPFRVFPSNILTKGASAANAAAESAHRRFFSSQPSISSCFSRWPSVISRLMYRTPRLAAIRESEPSSSFGCLRWKTTLYGDVARMA